MRAKCVICGTWVSLKPIDNYCRFCGRGPGEEDWCTKGGDIVCGDFTNEDNGWIYFDSRRKYRLICGYCQESFRYYSDVLVVLLPDGTERTFDYMDGVMLDRYYIADDPPTFYDLSDSLQKVIRRIVTGTFWYRTDAWRGYNAPPRQANGWVAVVDGWHSTREESRFSRSVNDLPRRKLPCPIITTFNRTSNVWATGVTIYAPVEHAEEVLKFLDLDTCGVGGVSRVGC